MLSRARICEKISEPSANLRGREKGRRWRRAGRDFNRQGAAGRLHEVGLAASPPTCWRSAATSAAERPREDSPRPPACGNCPKYRNREEGHVSADLKELLAAFKQEPDTLNAFAGRHHVASLRRDDEQHGRRRGQARALSRRCAGAERPAAGRSSLFDNLPVRCRRGASGAIRPVAVTAKKRLADSTSPRSAELLPGYEMTSWRPADLPTCPPTSSRKSTPLSRRRRGIRTKQRYADLGATAWLNDAAGSHRAHPRQRGSGGRCRS